MLPSPALQRGRSPARSSTARFRGPRPAASVWTHVSQEIARFSGCFRLFSPANRVISCFACVVVDGFGARHGDRRERRMLSVGSSLSGAFVLMLGWRDVLRVDHAKVLRSAKISIRSGKRAGSLDLLPCESCAFTASRFRYAAASVPRHSIWECSKASPPSTPKIWVVGDKE